MTTSSNNKGCACKKLSSRNNDSQQSMETLPLLSKLHTGQPNNRNSRSSRLKTTTTWSKNTTSRIHAYEAAKSVLRARAERSLAYEFYFVCAWGAAILAIPAILSLTSWLIISVWIDNEVSLHVWILVGTIALLIAYTTVLRAHSRRVLIRAGVFPISCSFDAYPRTTVELQQAAREIKQRFQRYPTIVGGGWGHFLWRTRATGPRIFTHQMTGRVKNGDAMTERWLAGTTIAEVQKYYLAQDLTLSSHPTMDYISIGSWVAYFNHGNDGNSNNTRCAIKNVTLLNLENEIFEVLDLHHARVRIETQRHVSQHVVVDVEFNLVRNDWLQKRALIINSPTSAKEWLDPKAELRLLFMGAARDYAIGLRWEEPYDRSIDHHDPHTCSRFCQFIQIDVCSALGGWHEALDMYKGLTKRYDANRWSPPIFPFMTVAVILSGTLNFEILFCWDDILDGHKLHQFIMASIKMHKRIGGRSEIRYGKSSSNTIFYWDVSLSRNFEEPFKLLRKDFKVHRVALHPGKYNSLSVQPCQRVDITRLSNAVEAL